MSWNASIWLMHSWEKGLKTTPNILDLANERKNRLKFLKVGVLVAGAPGLPFPISLDTNVQQQNKNKLRLLPFTTICETMIKAVNYFCKTLHVDV